MGDAPHNPPSDTALPSPRDAPAGLSSAILLELELKPVVRELHHSDQIEASAARWRARGYRVAVGEEVQEAADSGAMVTERRVVHTVRPLATHPLVERAVAVGGELARRVLLDPGGPVYRALCEWLGADQGEAAVERPSAATARARRALYVSSDAGLAEQARELDRMAGDDAESSPEALGALLGYPPCCVAAFCALERRWPNRLPIEAAMARTGRYLPRLNDLALDRFAYIGWFPCRYDCEASATLADAVARELARRSPRLVQAVDALLALPRVWRSDQAQAVLLDARATRPGRLAFSRLAPLEAVWPGPGDGGEPADAAWADLAGADGVRSTRGGAVFTAGGRTLRVDDPPLVLPFGVA